MVAQKNLGPGRLDPPGAVPVLVGAEAVAGDETLVGPAWLNVDPRRHVLAGISLSSPSAIFLSARSWSTSTVPFGL
jgi:hypothetical protein